MPDFLFKEMHLKMPSKCPPFSLGICMSSKMMINNQAGYDFGQTQPGYFFINPLTFFFQNVFLFSNAAHNEFDIFAWN